MLGVRSRKLQNTDTQ